MRLARSFTLAAAGLVASMAPSAEAEVLVHAAASLSDALKEVASVHLERTGVRVRLNLGASSTLARQLVEGAPGDVFFSADDAKMDQLETEGLLAPGTRRSLLSNTLVVVVAKDSKLALETSTGLAAAMVESVALADPASVPAGIYASEHLRRIGQWEQVSRKLVPTESVRAALAAVASGNVDAGIVYATDARASDGVRVAVEIPADQVPPVSYPAAVLAGSTRPAEARALVDFFASPECARIFERHGFIVKR